ncbi:trans-sulfuration enzyme family protein [Cognatishimia activa]|uniref:PLP-dependent transferase n=1 Tax=Cognatishimia activa TaxID=1715691 RepID=A0A975I657_9RHOB|nr:PLP-dependent transferase [Cognatishimia activa]QTN34554.1 PLP-dependent transferase [Cognatishimia activa]
MKKDLKPATFAAHAGGAYDEASGGVVMPIQPSTTYRRDEAYAPLNPDNVYLRPHNEPVRAAEAIIAELEGAAESLLFPAGMAAIAAAFRWLPTGARAVVQSGIYWGTTKWLRGFAERRGIEMIEVDASDSAALAEAIGSKVDLVFVETPSNPWLKTTDIAKAADLTHAAGGVLVVDSTAASPILTRPIEFGADIVMHSATKVMNGHSDVLGGVLSTAKGSEVWQAIKDDRADTGAVMGPFEAWLLVRGLRTLPLRIERMCQSAQTIAEYLVDHPQISDVFYPGLSSHKGHEIAKAQMSGGYGYVLSALVKGTEADALKVAGRLNLFLRATSIGGVESLVEHRHTIEPHTGIPETLLRLSIGIEDAGDLIDDLAQALGQ